MKTVVWLGCAAMAMFAAAREAEAFQKPKNNQEQRDNARVREARKELDEARGKANDAEKEVQKAVRGLSQAEAKEKAALRGIQETRDKTEERLGKGVGLDKAQADLKAAQVAFDKAKAPVVEGVHKSPEFATARKRADEAMEQLRASRGSGDKSRTAELTKLSLAPGQLEQKAVEGDPAAAAAYKVLGDLQQKVSSLREKIRKDVESHADVKAARESAESARDAVKSAKDDLVKERRDLGEAQQKVAQRQTQLAKAEAQDKQNDGKKKK